MLDTQPLETITIVAEARSLYGHEIFLSAGDLQPIGVVKLTYNNEADARAAYCRNFEITIREIPMDELVRRYAELTDPQGKPGGKRPRCPVCGTRLETARDD